MIETYKTVTGKHQPSVAPMLYKGSEHVTRGNDLSLEKSRVKYDLRKFSFSSRVVNIWNILPNWVISANTTNTFKVVLLQIIEFSPPPRWLATTEPTPPRRCLPVFSAVFLGDVS